MIHSSPSTDPEAVRALSAALPAVELCQLCGQTEGGPVVVHAIPRNPSGKIQKHLLRAELAG